MTRAVIIGYGRMGRMVERCIQRLPDWAVSGIVDPQALPRLADATHTDVAIDFSFPGDLPALLEDAVRRRIPLVIGRTGLTSAQMRQIEEAAGTIPIVQAGNFSLGVTVMRRMAREICDALGDGFDIEIVETHHRGKADAPSGTAQMLLTAVDPTGARPILHGRCGDTSARGREIGVHALRGGTAMGEHSVHFLGDMEQLTLTHRAEGREVFALGALRAAAYAVKAAPGRYDMDDVLFGGNA